MKVVRVALVLCFVYSNVIGTLANKVHVKGKEHVVKSKARTMPTAKVQEKSNTTTNVGPQHIESINSIVDVLIREAPGIMNNFNLNPLHAPDQTKKISLVTIRLKDIEIYNLTSIKRASDVIVSDDQEKHQLSIFLTLRFTKLRVEAMYKISSINIILDLSTKGNLTAKVGEVTALINVLIDFKELSASLESMNLSMPGNSLTVTLTGSLEGELANLVMPAITTLLQDVIIAIIENPLRNEINNILKNITSEIRKYFLTM